MDQLKIWLVTLIGVLLLLPLIGVSALGTVSTGVSGWLIALSVFVMGIMGLTKK